MWIGFLDHRKTSGRSLFLNEPERPLLDGGSPRYRCSGRLWNYGCPCPTLQIEWIRSRRVVPSA